MQVIVISIDVAHSARAQPHGCALYHRAVGDAYGGGV